LGLSFNSGIISAFSNITVDGFTNKMIQTNIPLNHGNSGGALINNKGQLIGITTLRLKDINADLLQGLSYSIPVSIFRLN
jgi:S1-C subfamily serine protease